MCLYKKKKNDFQNFKVIIKIDENIFQTSYFKMLIIMYSIIFYTRRSWRVEQFNCINLGCSFIFSRKIVFPDNKKKKKIVLFSLL